MKPQVYGYPYYRLCDKNTKEEVIEANLKETLNKNRYLNRQSSELTN